MALKAKGSHISGDVLVLPRESVIETPLHRIVRELAGNIVGDADRAEFLRFAGRVESVIGAWYRPKFQELLRLYDYFSPGGQGAKLMEQEGLEGRDAAAADVAGMELRFLGLLTELLGKASFHPLSRAEYQVATSSSYTLNLPVSVDVAKLDSSLLTRFLLTHKELSDSLPSFASHFLVFRRGVGGDSQEDLFVMEKANVLIRRVWVRLLVALRLRRAEPGAAASSVRGVREVSRRGKVHERPPLLRQQQGQGGTSPAGASPALGPGVASGAPPPPLVLEAAAAALAHQGARGPDGTKRPEDGAPAPPPSRGEVSYGRVRVESMPLSWSWLGTTRISEPTFREVVVIYRPAPPPGPKLPKKLGGGPAWAAGLTALAKKGAAGSTPREILIRVFKDVPLGDLELTFPEKKSPTLTPMDWLKMGITAVLGLVGYLTSVFSSEMHEMMQVLVVGLLTYASRVYFGVQAAVKAYGIALTSMVHSKQTDSGQGTLLRLCHQVLNQEVKESVLAFYMLLTQGKATLEELDDRCEDLLADMFGEFLDFDTSDACIKLLRLGVISKGPDDRYAGVGMKRANDILGATTDEVVAHALGAA